MLEIDFADKPRDWAPLVYCWRGGKRSGALDARPERNRLARGAARRRLPHVPAPRRRRSSRRCRRGSRTGSSAGSPARARAGSSPRWRAKARRRSTSRRSPGIAARCWATCPGDPQPSQKWFESQLLAALERLDPARPVYVESESRKIGTVQVPDALLAAMRASPCIRLDTPQPLRVALLKDEYAHFLADPRAARDRLAHLVAAARQGDARPLGRRGRGRRLGHAGRRAAAAPLRSDVHAVDGAQLPAPRRRARSPCREAHPTKSRVRRRSPQRPSGHRGRIR